MCSARLMRRLPARESRCRCWLPEDASSGAVPFQEAYRSRSARRWISPTSASNRAALDGPMPVSSSTVEPRSVTRVVSCFFDCFDLAVDRLELADQLDDEPAPGLAG